MKTNKSNRRSLLGFTMVEMLSVLAIVAILMGIVVPNAMYARVVSEESAIKAQSAVLQVAMSNYLAEYGNTGQANWAAAAAADTDGTARYALLEGANLIPQIDYTTFLNIYAGYTLTMPSTLNGTVTVTRNDGTETPIYP